MEPYVIIYDKVHFFSLVVDVLRVSDAIIDYCRDFDDFSVEDLILIPVFLSDKSNDAVYDLECALQDPYYEIQRLTREKNN